MLYFAIFSQDKVLSGLKDKIEKEKEKEKKGGGGVDQENKKTLENWW